MLFHITTRTVCHRKWFTPRNRSRIEGIIAAALVRSDASLLAHTIMPNHLHLLVQQGNAPLARLMQPLLRRVALLIQHTHGIEGHVFERRFRDKPCPDADYARNAIAYIHRNA